MQEAKEERRGCMKAERKGKKNKTEKGDRAKGKVKAMEEVRKGWRGCRRAACKGKENIMREKGKRRGRRGCEAGKESNCRKMPGGEEEGELSHAGDEITCSKEKIFSTPANRPRLI